MLEIKNLSFAVEEDGVRKEILHDLNLTIEDGRFVVITGPNGSGKSTLARLIMGIEKPTSGQILFDGQDVTALDIPSRAKLGISFAFQQPVRFKGIRVKDLLRLAGANAEERLDTPFLRSVRMRLPWLLVNLVTAFLASAVVRMFEGTIAQAVALSAIMTIVSGMGGNAGSQTMAIVVRAIAREDVPKAGVLAGLAKEAITGAIDGLAVGLVTGVVVAAVYGNLYLSLVVLAAMVGNMVIAGTSGLLVPVVLKACHQDPAVSSSIFVTTATDVLGFLLFLGLAQLFLPLIV